MSGSGSRIDSRRDSTIQPGPSLPGCRSCRSCLQALPRRVLDLATKRCTIPVLGAFDSALGSARVLVVVGTREDHFKKRWVEHEWRTFHQDILCTRKPESTPLATITQETDPFLLPPPLAHRQIVMELNHAKFRGTAGRSKSSGISSLD